MKEIRIRIVFIAACLCLQHVAASPFSSLEKQVDSLRLVLKTCKEDTNKIRMLNSFAAKLILSASYTEADSSARAALKLADQLKYEKLRGESYNKIGLCYLNQKNYAIARAYFFKAVACTKNTGNERGLSRYLGNIGLTYSSERDFTNGLLYHFQALAVAQKYNDKDAIIASTNNIGFIYGEKGQYKLALTYYFESLQMNNKHQDKNGMYYSLSNIGVMYACQSYYFKALDHYFKALKIANDLKDKNKKERTIWNIASAYQNIGNLPQALKYNFEALKLAEELKNEIETATVLTAIGNIYADLDDNEHAITYLQNGFKKMQQTGNKEGIASSIGTMGIVYEKVGDTAKALQYYFKAVELNKELGITIYVNSWLNNIACIYQAKASQHSNPDSNKFYFNKALHYYLEALKISETSNKKVEFIASYFFLGKYYISQREYKTAETYLKKGLILSCNEKQLKYLRDIYQALSDLYGKQNRLDLKFDYYKQYIELRDSLSNKESTKKLILSELDFEFQKKQALARSQQEKKDILTNAEKKRQVTVTWSAISFACLILIALGTVSHNYIQKRKINNELLLKNQHIETAHKIIEEKRNEITDSINYALKIQQALLPDRKDIEKMLPESFVLFKPKDIVSGDFYFFCYYHDRIYLAAADCTGHGVPGGFMSMIGTEKLHNAVKLSDDPGHILSLVNTGIKDSLHQSEHMQANRDGMDIALCAIDLKTNVVTFAGANRPIWIIRKNNAALEEIKGTKTSIGGFTENDKHFETHQIPMQKGDTFYIFSDGYADQFGVTNKKLTTKRLKNILIEIKDKSLHEQNSYLSDLISDWKSTQEQTDDILLIGVRV